MDHTQPDTYPPKMGMRMWLLLVLLIYTDKVTGGLVINPQQLSKLSFIPQRFLMKALEKLKEKSYIDIEERFGLLRIQIVEWGKGSQTKTATRRYWEKEKYSTPDEGCSIKKKPELGSDLFLVDHPVHYLELFMKH